MPQERRRFEHGHIKAWIKYLLIATAMLTLILYFLAPNDDQMIIGAMMTWSVYLGFVLSGWLLVDDPTPQNSYQLEEPCWMVTILVIALGLVTLYAAICYFTGWCPYNLFALRSGTIIYSVVVFYSAIIIAWSVLCRFYRYYNPGRPSSSGLPASSASRKIPSKSASRELPTDRASSKSPSGSAHYVPSRGKKGKGGKHRKPERPKTPTASVRKQPPRAAARDPGAGDYYHAMPHPTHPEKYYYWEGQDLSRYSRAESSSNQQGGNGSDQPSPSRSIQHGRDGSGQRSTSGSGQSDLEDSPRRHDKTPKM